MPKSKRGFTLIELLVTVSIIAILSIIGLVIYSQVLKNGRDAKRQSDLKLIQSALEQYRADQGFYPNNVTNFIYTGFDSALQNATSFTNVIGNPGTPTTTKTYVSKLPSEPVSATPRYTYVPYPQGCDNGVANLCTDYCLYAAVENTGNAIDTSCTNDLSRTLEVVKP